MDKDTAEGKTISERTFDVLDWAIIIIIIRREFVSNLTANINKIYVLS